MDFESNRRRDSGTANNIMYHFGRLNSKLNKANKDQLEKSSVAKAYPTLSSLYLLSASFLKVNHRVASVSSLCSAADVSSLKLVSTNERISQIHKYKYRITAAAKQWFSRHNQNCRRQHFSTFFSPHFSIKPKKTLYVPFISF